MPPSADSDQSRYCYKNSDVLKNIPGIRDLAELHVAERLFTGKRLAELERQPVAGHFDTAHLLAIHHRLFDGLYPFAGEFRTEDLAKWAEHRQDFNVFLPKENVIGYAYRTLDDKLAKTRFREMGPDNFLDLATQLYRDLNAIHAFPEGNGRTNREFIRTVGLAAGYHLDWSRPNKDRFLDTTVRSFTDPSVVPALRAHFDEVLVNRTPHPTLRDAYARLCSPTKSRGR